MLMSYYIVENLLFQQIYLIVQTYFIERSFSNLRKLFLSKYLENDEKIY